MEQGRKGITHLLMVLALTLMPALAVHAEGPAAVGGAAPTAAGISGMTSPISTSAPAVMSAPAPGNTSAFAPLNAPVIANQTGLPPVVSEKGLAAAPASDLTSPAALKDGKPGPAGQSQTASTELADISAFEKLISSSDEAALARPQQFTVGTLRQFGYSFFRSDAQGFAALTDIPVGPDYLIGNGDRLSLTLWGSIEGTL